MTYMTDVFDAAYRVAHDFKPDGAVADFILVPAADAAGPVEPAPAQAARMLAGLTDIRVRDTVLWDLAQLEAERAVEVVDDLPPWAAAMRVRDVAYLPRPPKP